MRNSIFDFAESDFKDLPDIKMDRGDIDSYVYRSIDFSDFSNFSNLWSMGYHDDVVDF